MAIVFALLTAALYGTSDFFGGVATTRERVSRVMTWAHLIGLVGVAIAAPLIADAFIPRDLGIGALAGVIGLVGLLLLYWALSQGPMAVVAPVSGVMSGIVPVLWGLRSPTGSISSTAWIGIALGLLAVVATSWPTDTAPTDAHSEERATGGVTFTLLIASAFAGSCFGALLLLYDATDPDGAPWPIVASRVVTVAMLVLYALSRKERLFPERERGAASIAGIGDVGANVLMLLASGFAIKASELSVVGVLVAFYPASTVLWARFRLKERVGPIRMVGFAIALIAIALMTLG